MSAFKNLLTGFAFCSSLACAQSLSFGLRGGVPLTDAFQDATYQGPGFVNHVFSNSKYFVLGPMVELHLPLGFSAEADALYRRLSLAQSGSATTSTGYSSWEFPILVKRSVFPLPLIRPYLEAGPAFRATGSTLSYFSKAGFTMGVGFELKLIRVRISPDIRYTHYGSDAKAASLVNFIAKSNVNQAEFLIGLSF